MIKIKLFIYLILFGGTTFSNAQESDSIENVNHKNGISAGVVLNHIDDLKVGFGIGAYRLFRSNQTVGLKTGIGYNLINTHIDHQINGRFVSITDINEAYSIITIPFLLRFTPKEKAGFFLSTGLAFNMPISVHVTSKQFVNLQALTGQPGSETTLKSTHSGRTNLSAVLTLGNKFKVKNQFLVLEFSGNFDLTTKREITDFGSSSPLDYLSCSIAWEFK